MGLLSFLRGLASAWTSPLDAKHRMYIYGDAAHAG
jgi:hypothetical protein